MFEELANNREVKIPISSFDRMLRLGAGALLVTVGISTGSWIVAGIGGIIAFLGIYDRCAVWKAITGILRSQWQGFPIGRKESGGHTSGSFDSMRLIY